VVHWTQNTTKEYTKIIYPLLKPHPPRRYWWCMESLEIVDYRFWIVTDTAWNRYKLYLKFETWQKLRRNDQKLEKQIVYLDYYQLRAVAKSYRVGFESWGGFVESQTLCLRNSRLFKVWSINQYSFLISQRNHSWHSRNWSKRVWAPAVWASRNPGKGHSSIQLLLQHSIIFINAT